MNDQIKEYLLYIGIALCIGYVIFPSNEDETPKVKPPSMEEFDDHPIVYMFDFNGKLIHQTPLALDRFKDGRERTETYVWKLYRTEWTSDIDPGYYTIVVGTEYDKRGIGTEIEVL